MNQKGRQRSASERMGGGGESEAGSVQQPAKQKCREFEREGGKTEALCQPRAREKEGEGPAEAKKRDREGEGVRVNRHV